MTAEHLSTKLLCSGEPWCCATWYGLYAGGRPRWQTSTVTGLLLVGPFGEWAKTGTKEMGLQKYGGY
jgi:hypothetical protein